MDKRFIKDSLWVGSSKVVTRLIGVIFFILVIKIISQEDYGFVRYVLSIASILVVFISSAYSTTLVRHLGLYAKKKELSEKIWSNTVIIISTLFVLCMVGAAIIGKFSWGLVVITFGLAFFDLYSALSSGTMQIKKVSIFNILSSVLKILFLLPFILTDHYTSAILVLLAYSLSFVLSGLLLEKISPTNLRLLPSLFSFDISKKLTKFAGHIMISGAATAIIGSVDLIIIERMMDLSTVAMYSLAKTFASVFILVPQSLSIILLPKIASFVKDARRINRYFIASMALVILSSAFVMVTYYFFGKELILVLSTEEYLGTYSILFLVSLGTFFSALYWIVSAFIIALGKPAVNTVIMIITGAIYITLMTLWVSNYGLFGIASAFAVAYLIGFIIIFLYYITYMHKLKKNRLVHLEVDD